jgi:hypothetical protein
LRLSGLFCELNNSALLFLHSVSSYKQRKYNVNWHSSLNESD